MSARLHPRQVEAFRAVMMTGGMTAAARHLLVSQPAISRLVRDFERSVGLKLFERDGARLQPRQEAIRLYQEVERLYGGLDHIAQAAEDIKAARGGVLRIAAAPSLAIRCAENAVAALASAYPDVAIVFDVESSRLILDMTSIGRYDIGFVHAHPDQTGVRVESLAEREAVCIAPPGHASFSRSAVRASDLATQRLILPGRRTPLRISLDAHFRDQGLRIHPIIETSLNHCARLVADGVGVSVVDILTAIEFKHEVAILPFRPRLMVRYAALFPLQAPRSGIVDMFANLARDAVRQRVKSFAF